MISLLYLETLTIFGIPFFSNTVSWFGSSILEICLPIIGVIFISQFRNKRLIRQSIAAGKSYAETQLFANYVKEIVDRSSLYEYEGYYPGRNPEFALEENKTYKERPSRLLYNRTNIYIENLYRLIPENGDHHAEKLFNILDLIQKESLLLGRSIYGQSQTTDIADETRQNLESCPKEIKKYSTQILQILKTIIQQ